MTEKEAIKARHSVRTYSDRKIEGETRENLVSFIEECNKESGLSFQFIDDAADTFNRLLNRAMGLGSAPSVIACVGPDDDSLDEKIGYYGERIVLYAQILGLNTCWAGTFNRKTIPAVIGDGERLVISIAIGYGKDQGKERKSKTIDQVAVGKKERPEWFINGVAGALLAPTAINQQKFEIRLNDDDTYEITDKGGVLSRVDLGIVRYNFEVASKA